MDSQPPMFDSLTHVTETGRWFARAGSDATVERLLRDMDAAGVQRACLVAIADHISNDCVLDAAGQYPDRFVPIGSLNPQNFDTREHLTDAIRTLVTTGCAGIKLHPRLGAYDPLDPQCIAAVELAGQHQLPVFLDTLFQHAESKGRSAYEIVHTLTHRCPETTLILLHGGGNSALDLFELVRQRPQLLLDLSFSIMRYAESSFDLDVKFLCQNLDQRVVLGSDFPEFTPAAVLERFLHLCGDLSRERLDNILYRNLSRVFPADGASLSQLQTQHA